MAVERLTCARWLCVSLVLLLAAVAQPQVAVPALHAPITDLTRTLTGEQVAALDTRLRDFESRSGAQIAVLLVPSIEPETIEEFSIRVADEWKVGRRGPDDGVLLVVAKQDRAVRIEVGYGLEGALPDVMANRIIDQVLVPRFREGDYFGGISAALDRIVALIEGESLPEPESSRPVPTGDAVGSLLPILFMAVFVGSSMLRRAFGAFGGAAIVAAVAGIIVWLLTHIVAIAIVATLVAFVLGLFGGIGGRGREWSNRSRRMGGFGGGWGGGGFGGGGGWSGGGGGFGGGGASGRW
jgi:uncharacterized protein